MFINLIAPINPLGYGVVGFNVLKTLTEMGHTVSYFPIGNVDISSFDAQPQLVQSSIENSFFYDKDAPCIRLWHQHEMDKFVGGGKRIGWPIFELNKFTDRELHQLRSLDMLFVCSEWAKTVCEQNNINPPDGIHVIPLGVDSQIFFPDSAAQASRPYWTKNSTVFLNVGKWEVRKGHQDLCEAFSKAFTPEDNVELWMMNDNPFIGSKGNEDWKRKFIGSSMGAKVKILPRVRTQMEMREIFNHVDCGVFPAHAEGWNLEILELMACGIPSIVTDYSGHTEFCNKENSLLVPVNGLESAQDGKWFHGQGEWGTFKVDDLVDALRAAHDQAQSGESVLSGACLETAQQFSWTNTVDRMMKVL